MEVTAPDMVGIKSIKTGCCSWLVEAAASVALLAELPGLDVPLEASSDAGSCGSVFLDTTPLTYLTTSGSRLSSSHFIFSTSSS
ncbi:hypothetical protein HPB50_023185 [Hyalomma asiaticum]|uniref:Uncharacterized protein n=1 Tax=Hyalomma asiaticum TaxID=266040 RepID=A0ACB7TM16_HYAAI|nr:hypothetical protein HPB50_023185 [Hyalomma asiaticum]